MKHCTRCGQEKPLEDFVKYKKAPNGRTNVCYACNREWHNKWRDENKTHVQDRTRDNYHDRASEISVNRKVWRDGVRNAVLEHYGMECACCGESHREFLAVDHVYGEGNIERRSFNGNISNFYNAIIKAGFPDGYQLLCHNCNLAKAFYGDCPHNEKVT